MGQVAGYTPADYLIQHASRERRYARVPASTWDAPAQPHPHPADAARLEQWNEKYRHALIAVASIGVRAGQLAGTDAWLSSYLVSHA